MKKLTALTVALMMSAGVAMAAGNMEHPQHPHGEHGKPHGKMFHKGKHGNKDGLPFGFAELNLTDAQKSQIKAIMEADRPQEPKKDDSKMAEFKQKMEAQRKQEQALMSSKTFDEATARKMIAERDQAREQQRQERSERELQMLKKRHAVFQVLTPAQQKQLQENQQKKMTEMEKRHAEFHKHKNQQK